MKKLKQYLPEFVYGSIDGVITTFAVVAGSTGASLGVSIVIILWLANLLADGLSMAVGSYLSSTSEAALGNGTSKRPLYSAMMTYAAFVTVGFIPLMSYVFWLSWDHFWSSVWFTAFALTIIGIIKSKITWLKLITTVSQTLFLWLLAALVAYHVWDILQGIVQGW